MSGQADAVLGQQKAAAAPPSVRLLFLIDITGSMSAELDACKGALRGMVSMLQNQADPAAGQLSFAVVTFTESKAGGCFTSLFESASVEAAQAYMSRIKLCRPPEAPDEDANGDDGPENHKAALARTTELDPSIPTIAFLITDAQPHINLGPASTPPAPGRGGRSGRGGLSSTAQHELDYLAAKHSDLSPEDARDFFKCFQQTTLAHFGSNLILNCVVYNSHGLSSQRPCDVQLLFAGLAQQTGGMLMQPESRDQAAMAAGLLSVVKALMTRLAGGEPEAPQQQQQQEGVGGADRLQGFRLIDLSGVTPDRVSEQDPAGVVEYGDTQALFNIAMDRMVAVCGKKWTKRAIGMSAAAEQLQFVWRAARYIFLCAKSQGCSDPAALAEVTRSKAEEMSKLLQLRELVVAALPPESKGHFSITEQDLKQMGEEAAAWAASGGAAAGGGAVSAISLASVGEALEDDAVWEDWLHSVMKLLLGCSVHVQLPLDSFGKPDFMDAWSAVLVRMGVDTISAAEFMQLIEDEPTAKGLTDKREYNGFLVMPDPGDKLASLVFKVASGTQALDYITSVAMGSNKGFLPNLHTGLTAACITKLLSQPTALTDFQWSQVQQLAHALCTRPVNAAKGVTKQLLAGQGNPEDNISKLLLALLRLYRGDAAAGGPDTCTAAAAADRDRQLQAALVLVLQEWLGSMMQRFYGKQTPENNDKYLQSVLTYIPVAAIFASSSLSGSGGGSPPDKAAGSGFNPLKQLHPLETIDASTLDSDGPVPASIRPDWQAAVLDRLLGAAGTPAHLVLGQFLLCAARLLALLPPAHTAASATAAAQAAVKSSVPSGDSAIGVALPGPAAALDSAFPQWKHAGLQALLLRFRTARYTNTTAPSSTTEAQPADSSGALAAAAASAAAVAAKPQWEAVPVRNTLALAVERLQEGLGPQLRSYRQARVDEARRQLLQVAAGLLRQQAGDADKACAALQQVKLLIGAGKDTEGSTGHDSSSTTGSDGPTACLLNVTYTLQRTDVPALLELLGAAYQDATRAQPASSSKAPQQAEQLAAGVVTTGAVTPGLLHMLVQGPWCPQPAQVLKRSQLVQQLCTHFGSDCEDLLAAINGLEVCCRAVGFNRHGHSADMPFPGPDGWTEAYAAARLAAVAGRTRWKQIKVKTALEAMQQFTAMAAWAEHAAAGDAAKVAAVAVVLSQERDARRHARVLAKLQDILGQTM